MTIEGPRRVPLSSRAIAVWMASWFHVAGNWGQVLLWVDKIMAETSSRQGEN